MYALAREMVGENAAKAQLSKKRSQRAGRTSLPLAQVQRQSTSVPAKQPTLPRPRFAIIRAQPGAAPRLAGLSAPAETSDFFTTTRKPFQAPIIIATEVGDNLC